MSHKARLHLASIALLAMSAPVQSGDRPLPATPPAVSAAAMASDFNIIQSSLSTAGRYATFHMAVSGIAGRSRPAGIGQREGSAAFSYFWVTSINPYEVGFERDGGVLALEVTTHPDYDDTPLFDENRDGDHHNDGGVWHTHFVVLEANDACGNGALAIADIPAGQKPRMPASWPGLPMLIDSPGWDVSFSGDTVEARAPLGGVFNAATAASFTARLRIGGTADAPLACVTDVFKVGPGDVDLPKQINV